jgi:hypothetical protein
MTEKCQRQGNPFKGTPQWLRPNQTPPPNSPLMKLEPHHPITSQWCHQLGTKPLTYEPSGQFFTFCLVLVLLGVELRE